MFLPFFDKNGDGYISKSELKSAMKKMDQDCSDEAVERMFAEADLDGDGEVSFKEFVSRLDLEGQQQEATSDRALALELQTQLALDGDGEVSFKEFVSRLDDGGSSRGGGEGGYSGAYSGGYSGGYDG